MHGRGGSIEVIQSHKTRYFLAFILHTSGRLMSSNWPMRIWQCMHPLSYLIRVSLGDLRKSATHIHIKHDKQLNGYNVTSNLTHTVW